MPYAKPSRRSWAEPWKIKMVEPIRMTTRQERDNSTPAIASTPGGQRPPGRAEFLCGVSD